MSETMMMMKHLAGPFWFAGDRFVKPGLYFKTKRILPLPRIEPTFPELIEFAEQTDIIAKDQPQYRPLPAYLFQNDPEGRMVFCWKLSLRDRLRLLVSGKLWHQVLTFRQPLQPQLITLQKPEMPKQP